MGNPVILYDNRFLDGSPIATDTGAGYNALFIRDLKSYTFWQALNATGNKYMKVDAKGGSTKHGQAIGGATTAAGKVGNGGVFDGVDDYVTIPHHNSLNIATRFTLAFWAYRTGTAAIFAKGGITAGWDLAGGGGGDINLRSYGFGSAVDHIMTNYIPASTWTYCVITYDATAGANNLRFYRNGSFLDSITETGGLLINNSGMAIGYVASAGQIYTGNLDEVAIWNRALTAAEITALYNSGSGMVITGDYKEGLVGYWRMDEALWNGTAGEVIDSSGLYANCLGLFNHNFGTAGSSISVESSSDDFSGGITERLAAFSTINDFAILKKFNAVPDQHWRLKMAGSSITPKMAIAMIGTRLDLPFPPDTPYNFYDEGMELEARRSQEAHLLENIFLFNDVKLKCPISVIDREWAFNTFKPFWDNHARKGKPFLFAYDLENYPNAVWWMRLTDSARFQTPISMGGYVDTIIVDMEGVREE